MPDQPDSDLDDARGKKVPNINDLPEPPSTASQSRVARVLAHPLSSILLGFLLSGLVGWWLSSSYVEKQRAADQQREEYEKSVKAIQELSRDAFRRYARSNMLLSTFNRGASLDELRTRKRDYDESVVEWMTNYRGNLLLTRELFGEAPFLRLQKNIGDRLLHDFNDIDECLTNAYDSRMGPSDDKKTAATYLERCEIEKKLDSVNDTCYELTDDLFVLASGQVASPRTPKH